MAPMTRLPAFPLIANDPYFSIWSCADLPTSDDTRHWAGQRKRLHGVITIDGKRYRYLGKANRPAMQADAIEVTPTSTRYTFSADGVSLSVHFTSPLLLKDLDILSTPITYIDHTVTSLDGKEHEVKLDFAMFADICYEGEIEPELRSDSYRAHDLDIAYIGQKKQSLLCHSGDHITIDWGYAYLAAKEGVTAKASSLNAHTAFTVSETPVAYQLMAGYDDIASINYFGFIAPAWYARNGKTIMEALFEFADRHDEIIAACNEVDEEILSAARKIGGEDYANICAAAYRQTIAAHKLIADREGKAIFLSKECDSNGCIGTVDVSYPSIPLYLIFCPELVKGMCRPVLKFAQMPCWEYDFAPHDVGRYPQAIGQVYALRRRADARQEQLFPPIYLYPAGTDAYDFKSQMPVEECGNMLVMLAAIYRADGDISLARDNMNLLDKWVRYLEEFGEDPGEQLCTDDFAGHMARNINLSAKAISGVASYALIKKALGEEEAYETYMEKARGMAKRWLERAQAGDHTALTFDGNGWSMKYNLIWDILFGLDLLPKDFYEKEIAYYISIQHQYGLPLDSRSDYTKSDWIAWVAAMAPDQESTRKLLAPIATYLRETPSRVPFSDWYYTTSGEYQNFINRTVQGGLFMPMLRKHWGK